MHFIVGFRVVAALLVLLSQRRAACCVGRIRGPHATSVRPIRQGRWDSSKPLWPQWALGAGCAAPWLRYVARKPTPAWRAVAVAAAPRN